MRDLDLRARKGAPRMRDVPEEVLDQLAAGSIETVNLMEWLAADMSALAINLAEAHPNEQLASALRQAAADLRGRGVTDRLRIAGKAVAAHAPPGSVEYDNLASHKSDLVRQWVCYAANDSSLSLTLDRRLEETLRFAADGNMSVRETAWMAFRPHLAERFGEALPKLIPLAGHENENIRRFAVEVTRPRSVWGAHLHLLKRDPDHAIGLLEQVRADPSRYVRLAVGNWLNDASKSRPDWVLELSRRWRRQDNPHTASVLKRGLRTISRMEANRMAGGGLSIDIAYDTALEPMETAV
jgi:3-methyladenine DNA glycosylase AlkC